LYLTADDPWAQVLGFLIDNVLAEARFLFTSGAVYLEVRQPEAGGGYKATLDSSGQVNLYKNGQWLASGLAAANTPNQWRTMRLSAIDNTIRVWVDGAYVITFLDDSPLPTGIVALGGENLASSELLVDDISLWTPVEDALAEFGDGNVSANSFSLVSGPNAALFPNLDGILFTGNTLALPQDVLAVSEEGVTYPALRSGYNTAHHTDWAASRRQRVFECTVPGTTLLEICIGNLDGSGTTNLTNSPTAAESGPVFSPDSNWVAYEFAPNGGSAEIRARNLTTNNEVIVLRNEDLPTFTTFRPDIDWGPDNRIYVSLYAGGSAPEINGIYGIDMSNPNNIPPPEQITSVATDGNASGTFPCQGHANPDVVDYNVFSGTEYLLLFTRCYTVFPEGTGYNSIYVYNLSLNAYPPDPDRIIHIDEISDLNYAVWSPDGRNIAYQDLLPNNKYDIYIISSDPALPVDPQRVPIDSPYQNILPYIAWVPEILPPMVITPTPLPATQTAVAILTQQAQATVTPTSQAQPSPTPEPQECAGENEPWWQIQRFNQNKPRPEFPQSQYPNFPFDEDAAEDAVGLTTPHHGVNGSWMKAIFGSGYDYNTAWTVLMPRNIHRTLNHYWGPAGWQLDTPWAKVHQVALDDFRDSNTPEDCREDYWDEFRREAKYAVCELLRQFFEAGVQTVSKLFLRGLEVFDWLEDFEGYSDPCDDPNLNNYARSLPRTVTGS